MPLQEYVRPQKHNSWFNVSPLRDLDHDATQRLDFLDSYVTVTPAPGEPGFTVNYEGREELRVEKHYGFLCVWFGDDLETPGWDFPTLFEQPYETDFVIMKPRVFENTNLLDLIENNGDLIHFKTVHRWLSVKLSEHHYDEKVFRLKMAGQIQYARSADHPLKRRASESMPVWEYSQELSFHGPGFGAGEVQTDVGIEARIILAFTPVGENDLKLHVAANVNPASLPRAVRLLDRVGRRDWLHRSLSWAIAKAGLDDTDGDYRIWRHKRSISDPKLLPNEQDILRIREWMAQYYMRDFEQPEATEEPRSEWRFLAHASDVLPDQVNTFSVSGEELVAYRADDGELRVFDAFCPHQGAHLGHGGRLEGDCIACPFHEFYFDGGGAFLGSTPDGKPKPQMKLDVIPHRQAGQRIEVLL